MKVYVVMCGEQYEGGAVDSVHATVDGARTAWRKLVDDLTERWSPIAEGDEYKVDETELYALIGCDFVSVEEYEVQP